MKRQEPRWRGRLAAVMAVMLLAGACGGDGAEDEGGTTDSSASEDLSTLAGVQAAVADMSDEEREAFLLETAAGEPQLVIYTSNSDVAETLGPEFEAATGLSIVVFEALSQDILRRTVEELAARPTEGPDIIESNGPEMVALEQEGVFAPITTGPVTGLPDVARFDTWTSTRNNAFVIAWNTDEVTAPPESVLDLADPAYSSNVVIDAREFGWFRALWEYLAEQGESEADIETFFRDLIANSSAVTSHDIQLNLVAAGEFSATPNAYYHHVLNAQDDGAPVAIDPGPGPLFLQASGVGVIGQTDSPAAALLFFDWILTDGSGFFAERRRLPPSELATEGVLEGWDVRVIDPATLIGPEADEWSERFQRLLEGVELIEE